MRRADIEVPKLPVDTISWGRLACYPRGSFYPLSYGPSTRNRRITLTDFRPCSTCMSRSQATLCQYTLRLISIQPEVTFVRLRYLLGGDRPSQTAYQTLFLWGVRFKRRKGRSFMVDSTQAGACASKSPAYYYTSLSSNQCQAAVKLHGVYLSCRA